MTFKNYRDQSRGNWGTHDETISRDKINTGAMLRIADATEKMAVRHTELINSRDMYKRLYEQECSNVRHVDYQLRGARGQITKLKKQLAALKEQP